MAITYGTAKKILSQWAGRAGKCPGTEDVDLFVREVLQYLLYSGQYGNIRKFCFKAVKGCITVPYELEVPLKIKIEGEVGTVWDRWFEYHSSGEMKGCTSADEALYEEPNPTPLVYDIPAGGSRIGVLGTANEAPDATIIVSGVDPSGREIMTSHRGSQVSGEAITIRKGELRYTNVAFAKVTAVLKPKTVGYVQLLWVRPEASLKGFLADYAPLETTPSYRRFKLTSGACSGSVKVSILGRIRLKDNYSDSDLIPFDNLYALSLAGQTIHANYNSDVNVAQVKDTTTQNVIARESEYKRVNNGQPIEVFVPLSGGSVRNVV